MVVVNIGLMWLKLRGGHEGQRPLVLGLRSFEALFTGFKENKFTITAKSIL